MPIGKNAFVQSQTNRKDWLVGQMAKSNCLGDCWATCVKAANQTLFCTRSLHKGKQSPEKNRMREWNDFTWEFIFASMKIHTKWEISWLQNQQKKNGKSASLIKHLSSSQHWYWRWQKSTISTIFDNIEQYWIDYCWLLLNIEYSIIVNNNQQKSTIKTKIIDGDNNQQGGGSWSSPLTAGRPQGCFLQKTIDQCWKNKINCTIKTDKQYFDINDSLESLKGRVS